MLCFSDMTIQTKDFILIPTDVTDDVVTGCHTEVRHRKSLTGDIVEKIRRPFVSPHDWEEGLWSGKRISDQIRALRNPAYDVPRTYISPSGRVYENFVAGMKIYELPDNYIEKNKDWIVPAVANFINDMARLSPPIFSHHPADYIPELHIANAEYVARHMDAYSPYISKQDAEFITNVYKYLCASPSVKDRVFIHRDLHDGNVIIDTKRKRVAFIDFEYTDYVSKFNMMYNYTFSFIKRIPEVFNYIDTHLNNSGFLWHFDRDEVLLFDLMSDVEDIICTNDIEESIDCIKGLTIKCRDLRAKIHPTKLDMIKNISRPTSCTLVPVSHYQKHR